MSFLDTIDTPQGTSRPNTIIAYHANCIDGFTSAWVAAKGMYDRGHNCRLVAMAYTPESMSELGNILMKGNYTTLLVVDFSLDIDVISTLRMGYTKLEIVIIDHHKTAFEKYAPELVLGKTSWVHIDRHGAEIYLDNDESGASLCWKVFNVSSEVPKLIQYVRDYDLWRFDMGLETKWVNKYLGVQDKNLENWSNILIKFELAPELHGILRYGKSLQARHDKLVEEVASHSWSVTIGGIYKGEAVQCPYALVSDVGHQLAIKSGSYGLMYQVTDTEIKCSLRSNRLAYDVTTIAKNFGGGGHAQAAGFTVKRGSDSLRDIIPHELDIPHLAPSARTILDYMEDKISE